jgi:hypothetical protein
LCSAPSKWAYSSFHRFVAQASMRQIGERCKHRKSQ